VTSDPPRTPWRPPVFGPGQAMLAELMNNHLDPGYAAAKEASEQREPPSPGRVRVRRGITALTLAVIGVVLAAAFHQAVAHAPDAAKANAGLVSDVKNRSAQTDQLQKRAEQLREEVAREREAALASTEAGAQTATDLRDLEASVGVGPVAGPGIVVTAGDGPEPRDPVTNELTNAADPARLLDRDLQELVNALWESGAEAIAIDGQRLTPTSTIRLAGDAILVDLRPVSSPYRIDVVGDPLTMDDRFNASEVADRFRAYKSRYAIVFSVATASRIALAAATAPVLRYARAPSPSPSPRAVSPGPRRSSTTHRPAAPSSPGGGR
jgi:uncharacterized protein YlxW (UPF0749 family)